MRADSREAAPPRRALREEIRKAAPRAAAATARPNEPEQRDRLRQAVERVGACALDDKQARDLALDLRGDQIRAGLSQRLPAKDLSSRIDDN